MNLDAFELLTAIAFGSLLIPGVAYLTIWSLRRSSAEERHLILACAVVALLLLPAATVLLPKARVPLAPIDLTRTGVTQGVRSAVSGETAVNPLPLGRISDRQSSLAGATSTKPRRWISLAALARLYAAIAGLILVYSLGSTIGTLRRLRSLAPIDDPATTELTARLASRIGLRQPVRLLAGDSDRTPWAWGLIRRSVVLPAQFWSWPAEEQRNAIAHELAHIRRRDTLSLLLGRLTCALYWLQPLAWLVVRRMTREAEQACDDRVLLCGADRSTYAAQLLAIAKAIYRDAGRRPLASAMAGRSSVTRRIKSILDERTRRTTVGRFKLTSALATMLLLVVPLAVLRSQQAETSDLNDPALQALLRAGPGTEQELTQIVDALIANDMSAQAEQVLTDWITSHDTCGICLRGLMNDAKPASALTSVVLHAFDAVEEIAQNRGDGALVMRLAAISLQSRNTDAIDRGMAYLVHAKLLGNDSGDSSLLAVQYLTQMGQYDDAKALLEQLNDDQSSAYYQSETVQRWLSYIGLQRRRMKTISARLMQPADGQVAEKEEYLPLYKEVPVYPEDAARAGREGTVVVEFTVAASGRTKDVHVVSSTDEAFDQVAVDSAQNYRYIPRLDNGVPVDVPGVRTKIAFVLQR